MAGASVMTGGRTAVPVLIASALAYVSLLPYPYIAGPVFHTIPVLRLVPLGIGLVLAVYLLAWKILDHNKEHALPLAAPLLGLFLVQTLGSIQSVDPGASLGKTAFYFVTGPVFFLAASVIDRRAARALLLAVAVLGLVSGLVSVIEVLTGSVPLFGHAYEANNPYVHYEGLVGRSFGLAGHPVFLGGFFVLALAAAFYAVRTAEGPVLKLFAFVGLAAGLVGLFLTFSRGAWAAVAVSAIVFYGRRLHVARAIAAAAVLVALIVGLSASSGRVWEVLKSRDPVSEYVGNADTAHRLRAFGLTARIMGDVPLLGAGTGNYRTLYNRYRDRADDSRQTYATPDNMYLAALAETGMAGLALLVFILMALYRLLSGDGLSEDALALAGSAAVAGFCVDIFFFDAFYVESLRVLFWSMAGCCVGQVCAAGGRSGQCQAL